MRSNPYVRGVFIAGGTYAAGGYGPLAGAALGAYATKLDGGSSLDALRAGIISGVASYAGGALSDWVGGTAGGEIAGQFAGATVDGAASGAIASTLSGGDPGQGALYGAAYGAVGYVAVGAISFGAQTAYDYYATKDAVVTRQITVDQSGEVSPGDQDAQVLVAAVGEFGTAGAAADAAEAAQFYTPGGGVVGTTIKGYTKHGLKPGHRSWRSGGKP